MMTAQEEDSRQRETNQTCNQEKIVAYLRKIASISFFPAQAKLQQSVSQSL